MRAMTTTGRFITFEGGEGSGKSTQVKRLAERLRLHGYDVVETREPGGSPGAEAIRHLLLAGVAKPLGTEAEAMLFAAARDDHMTSTIRPALQRGAWVICDRFIDSTRVYQGALGNVDPRLIRSLERLVVGPDVPDLTLMLDLDPNVGLTRVNSRGEATNRFEDENFEFHKQLRAAYRDVAEQEPERCVLIDADANQDVVAVRVWMAVSERLLRPSRDDERAAG
ncbi:MAG TPA: dTMP kinase [Xanthobacteraceae bacterium]|nr:dTMP kinase [Xanthobacteraceae bacterium]